MEIFDQVAENEAGMSAKSFKGLRDEFLLLPDYVQESFLTSAFTIMAGETLVGCDVELLEHSMTNGLFSFSPEIVYFSEYRLSPSSGEWVEMPPAGSLFHEMGHYVDYVVLNSGTSIEGTRSGRDDFLQAFWADKESLIDTDFRDFYKAYKGHEKTNDLTMMARIFENGYLLDDDWPTEVYAELWSHLHGRYGSMPKGMDKVMPRCAEVVENDDAFLTLS